MKTPRRVTLATMLCAAACTGSVAPDGRALRGSVGLSRSATEIGAPVTGTFRSVVDSVELSITAGATVQSIAHRFALGETSASLPVTLPAGVATISAQVWSNNATLLFSGDTSATIDHDGFSIDVRLAATASVLVVFPDTLKVDSVSDGIRFGSLRVRNSGIGTLSWGVTRDTAGTGAICGSQGCSALPNAGRLTAGQEQVVTFVMPSLLTTGGRFPAGTFTYRFASAQGTVIVLWRYPASP